MKVTVLKNFNGTSANQHAILLNIEGENIIYTKNELLRLDGPCDTPQAISTAVKKLKNAGDFKEVFDEATGMYQRKFAYKVAPEELNATIFNCGKKIFIAHDGDALLIDLVSLVCTLGRVETVNENDSSNPTAFVKSDLANGVRRPDKFQAVKIDVWAKENTR